MALATKLLVAAVQITALASSAAGSAAVSAVWMSHHYLCLGSCSEMGGPKLLGPDGPWRALNVNVGTRGLYSDMRRDSSSVAAMYPSGLYYSVIPAKNYDWLYDPADSETANLTREWAVTPHADRWSPIVVWFEEVTGELYSDFSIAARASGGAEELRVNTSILVANATYHPIEPTRDGVWSAKPPAGTLGLARHRIDAYDDVLAPGYIQQLKDGGLASSESFGLNMGSVTYGPSGSMYFGGYEKNRALGDVAVLDLDKHNTPRVFLFDVTLGVEIGGSPFNRTGEDNPGSLSGKSWSVWDSLNTTDIGAKQATELQGGPSGAMSVTINPAVPYLYLPTSVCEAIAEYLPVTWREDVRFFVWDTDDDRFERIVTSPAYMGFIFADRDRNNVTIKVPFALLNLTLTEPLVDDGPVRYFPCKGFDNAVGELGRAFLQGAFFGINYDNDIAYLAQGPGPDLDQSVLQYFADFDDKIESDPAEAFEKTWRNTWTVLEDDSSDSELGSGSIPGRDDDGRSALSTGAIAGTVVGSVAGLGLLAGAVFFFFFWRGRQSRKGIKSLGSEPSRGSAELKDALSKVNGHSGTQEMPGHQVRRELDAPNKAHEAPGVELRHELQ